MRGLPRVGLGLGRPIMCSRDHQQVLLFERSYFLLELLAPRVPIALKPMNALLVVLKRLCKLAHFFLPVSPPMFSCP